MFIFVDTFRLRAKLPTAVELSQKQPEYSGEAQKYISVEISDLMGFDGLISGVVDLARLAFAKSFGPEWKRAIAGAILTDARPAFITDAAPGALEISFELLAGYNAEGEEIEISIYRREDQPAPFDFKEMERQLGELFGRRFVASSGQESAHSRVFYDAAPRGRRRQPFSPEAINWDALKADAGETRNGPLGVSIQQTIAKDYVGRASDLEVATVVKAVEGLRIPEGAKEVVISFESVGPEVAAILKGMEYRGTSRSIIGWHINRFFLEECLRFVGQAAPARNSAPEAIDAGEAGRTLPARPMAEFYEILKRLGYVKSQSQYDGPPIRNFDIEYSKLINSERAIISDLIQMGIAEEWGGRPPGCYVNRLFCYEVYKRFTPAC